MFFCILQFHRTDEEQNTISFNKYEINHRRIKHNHSETKKKYKDKDNDKKL